MKQIIVIIGCTILGVIIAQAILGDGSGDPSLLSAAGDLMKGQLTALAD